MSEEEKVEEKAETPEFVSRPIHVGEGHFHFLTVTAEGLEILGEPSGEKTVIQDLAAMRSLNGAVLDWLQANTCHAFMVDPDHLRNGSRLHCLLKAHHKEEMHFARRYNSNFTAVTGVVYWSDDMHAAEFHNAT